MNIILGASGQVGSAITDILVKQKLPVRAVIRDVEKADALKEKGAEVAIADYFDLPALKKAFKGGKLIFVITPEWGQTEDLLGDTKLLLENYRKAIAHAGIKSVIGLSSGGAQYEKYERDTGNLLVSNMLEHEFLSLPVYQVFIRPSYYYSNWLMSVDMAKENGILPSFYPPDVKIAMNSPMDVAGFIAHKISEGVERSELIELVGPREYSPNDVAKELSVVLGREVKVQEIPREKWAETMKSVGFSDDATSNFIKMTEVVAEGQGKPEGKLGNPVRLSTTLGDYFREWL